MTAGAIIWIIILIALCTHVAKDFRRIELQRLEEENAALKKENEMYRQKVKEGIITEAKKNHHTQIHQQ